MNSRIVGIVGSEGSKFTPETERKAKEFLVKLINNFDGVASGECHLGGIDIWAKEECLKQGKIYIPCAPEVHQWDPVGKIGYMQRNMLIAEKSNEVICVTVKDLPASYTGLKFKICYHCGVDTHVKSGGCWTTKYARSLGKYATTVVIE